MPWFPVVGALIGLLVGGVAAGLAEVVTPSVAAAVAIVVGMLVTGAFHEDGLADLADAVAGGATRERRLEILKDPRHGTYGVAALVGSVLVRWSALAALVAVGPRPAIVGALAAHALARGIAVGVMGVQPAARTPGLGADWMSDVGRRHAAVGLALGTAAHGAGRWLVDAARGRRRRSDGGDGRRAGPTHPRWGFRRRAGSDRASRRSEHVHRPRRPRGLTPTTAARNRRRLRARGLAGSPTMQRRSVISTVERAPKDPILGLTETFNADARDGKVNLGVGVYLDESGKVPLLECVRSAEERLAADPTPFGYLPIDGIAAYDNAVADLVLSGVVPRDRLAVVQTLGGTGALKVAADFLHQLSPDATVLLSDPELGEPPGAVHPGRVPGRELSVLRPRHPRPSMPTGCWRPSARPRPARSSCSTPVVTTRPGWT